MSDFADIRLSELEDQVASLVDTSNRNSQRIDELLSTLQAIEGLSPSTPNPETPSGDSQELEQWRQLGSLPDVRTSLAALAAYRDVGSVAECSAAIAAQAQQATPTNAAALVAAASIWRNYATEKGGIPRTVIEWQDLIGGPVATSDLFDLELTDYACSKVYSSTKRSLLVNPRDWFAPARLLQIAYKARYASSAAIVRGSVKLKRSTDQTAITVGLGTLLTDYSGHVALGADLIAVRTTDDMRATKPIYPSSWSGAKIGPSSAVYSVVLTSDTILVCASRDTAATSSVVGLCIGSTIYPIIEAIVDGVFLVTSGDSARTSTGAQQLSTTGTTVASGVNNGAACHLFDRAFTETARLVTTARPGQPTLQSMIDALAPFAAAEGGA